MDWKWEVNDVDGVDQLTKDALYNTLASRASYGVSYESICKDGWLCVLSDGSNLCDHLHDLD